MKQLTCIVCPRGCRISVDRENLAVSGNGCENGRQYAISEITNPLRTLTSTVKIKSKFIGRCPVKTRSPIPKDLLLNAAKALNGIEVVAPVKTGQIIVKNVLNTGADIVATRTIFE